MSHTLLRLVHTSDLHLERPLHGLAEIPEHLRDLLLDAPYLAAEQMFETAVAEEVDLVVLAGDIVDPQVAAPRAAEFLDRHFQRLAERGIHVYWAGSAADAGACWQGPQLYPATVHRFADGRLDEHVHHRAGEPVARIVGFSGTLGARPRGGEFPPGGPGLPTIGVGYGPDAAAALSGLGASYLALGGEHARQQRADASCLVHYPGSPQGRCPDETGPHGCTVVAVDAAGQASTTFVATDVVRWIAERVEADEMADREALEAALIERMDRHVTRDRGLDLLVTWTVAGGADSWMRELRYGGLAADLLARLRQRYGQASPAAWSVSLRADAAASVAPSVYDQETILGDFLRAVREYRTDAARPLDLDAFMAAGLRTDPRIAGAALPGGDARQSVLKQVERLGADLLGTA